MKHAYQIEVSELIKILHTNPTKGLSSNSAQSLLKHFGLNELPEQKQPSWLWVFICQFASPLIYILILAAVLIYFVAHDRLDAFIIFGILLFNAIVGTIQEGRTRKILLSLKQLIVQECVVIRDGKKRVINATQLVPGDIIIIQAGQRVPADARIIESHNLRIDEAMLTGESNPIHKSNIILKNERALADRINMIYSGTYVLAGWARALVVATGINTEIGKIHQTVQQIQTDVPLAREMTRLSWWILYFILCFCGALFLFGLLIGQPIKELIVMLTALFICVIPEGLPVVLTLVLVNGVYRMAKQRVLVKNMQAVEGLGHANVIVIDKTGTLTRNEMIVSHVFADEKIWTVSGKGYYPEGSLFLDNKVLTKPFGSMEHEVRMETSPLGSFGASIEANGVKKETDLFKMAEGLSLLNTTTITLIGQQGTFSIKGDPTEAALFVFSQKMGINNEQLEQEFEKVYEIPFEAKHKYHAAFFIHNGDGIAFITGSPELIFKRSKASSSAQHALREFLSLGLRVIAVAIKNFDASAIALEERQLDPTLIQKNASDQEKAHFFNQLITQDVIFLGLCGIEDSIRSEAPTTIAKARKAGFQIIMATGDHQRTALAIAKQVGIYKEGDEAIDGPELDTISDDQLKDIIIHATVFSRVSPEQKLRIINALHAHNLTVAMTGDGINDAPSLVAADIGIGMGGIGTEVAKEASDIILLDDSVVNIIHGIEEGRHTIYTLRRVISYFFSTNLAEILIILFAFLVGFFYPTLHLAFPLTAAQILWLNLVTDGFLDSALALEKKEKGLLFDQKWLKGGLRLIDFNMIARILYAAIPMALGSLFMFIVYSQFDLLLARTMTLVTLGMFQWFNAWNCRSDTKSIFQIGLFTNRWLLLALAIVFILQLLLLHVPFLQKIFATQPLNIYQWIFIAIISSWVIWLEEIRKWFARMQEA
jgi:P-type Ca2+ transporter type 2C